MMFRPVRAAATAAALTSSLLLFPTLPTLVSAGDCNTDSLLDTDKGIVNWQSMGGDLVLAPGAFGGQAIASESRSSWRSGLRQYLVWEDWICLTPGVEIHISFSAKLLDAATGVGYTGCDPTASGTVDCPMVAFRRRYAGEELDDDWMYVRDASMDYSPDGWTTFHGTHIITRDWAIKDGNDDGSFWFVGLVGGPEGTTLVINIDDIYMGLEAPETRSPTTASPTAKPTPSPPTTSPTTVVPTVSPTTAPPTASPTASPTANPTTSTPTSSSRPSLNVDYACPLPGEDAVVVVVAPDGVATINLSTAVPNGGGPTLDFLCLLSLRIPPASTTAGTSTAAVRQPVARTYAGRVWEVAAGPFAELLKTPVCDSDAGEASTCVLELPVDAKTLGEDRMNQYILTSYSHGVDARSESARFLEQATFGATLANIDALASTTPSSTPPDFASWITNQMNTNTANGGAGYTSHREFFRRHTNPRYEYPFRGGGPAPTKACDVTSRWRKFALTERDGIVSSLTNQNKMLHFEYKNGRYVWYVEGMPRTTTKNLGYMMDVGGTNTVRLKIKSTSYYINEGRYINDNHKYSCVGCPVRICNSKVAGSDGCGYISNPGIDLTGIENTGLAPYTVVDLPKILDGSNDMVGIDDGPYLRVLEPWQKADDEFWLNATVDARQCRNHPSPMRPLPSEFNHDQFGLKLYQHMESAQPTIYGRSLNAETGDVETLVFDPIFKFYENTLENPLGDGGGSAVVETKGWADIHPFVKDAEIHCANAKRTFLNEDTCKLSFDPNACYFEGNDDGGKSIVGNGKGVVVCGSPGEVSSDFSLGVIDGFTLKSFTARQVRREIYKDATYTEQKHTIWAKISLTAEDQLRQRIAWALYQIVPVGSTGGFVPNTETWLIYYDIFVRHAFGNYRNVLKEVSFNQLMSEWLSFKRNASIQYALDNGNEIYPDENYAREVMQLFSIGLYQLNMDGTRKTDDEGNFLYTYTSDDIQSYSRAWTGFEQQQYARGNTEEKDSSVGGTIDPLRIERTKRDLFPKSDLSGGYIGDGYPLCADLPSRDFLRKGATFLTLGSQSDPEQQHDGANAQRPELNPDSPLYAVLCAPNAANGECTYPAKVVLEENLIYDPADAHRFVEHGVDTIRSVCVTSGSVPVYYEYIRPPCVHQNFFNGGRKVIAGDISNNLIVNDSMCADARVATAAETCCSSPGTNGGRNCEYNGAYNGERMKFVTAVERCAENNQEQCNPNRWNTDVCSDTDSMYSWSSVSCAIRAKVSFETGQVARVDYPGPDAAGERIVKNLVRDDTKNFFQVPWSNIEVTSPSDASSCDALPACYSVEDGCVCDTHVVETPIFSTKNDIVSKANILKSLLIGAFDPAMFDEGYYSSLGDCGVVGIEIYTKNNSGCNDIDSDTIFDITDGNGVQRFLKNMVSTVTISGISSSFRNPVHFIDFMDRSVRDMYHETDAVIDSYFYHPSHAPFMSYRFIQRFGISNPSPPFIERVSTAFKTGSYIGRFGSGKYGDLGAMIAAILLDPESRNPALDSDNSHGHIREPFIKIFSLLRSMEAYYHAPLNVPLLNGPNQVNYLGQGSYRSLSVFSFFLPEFVPSGSLGDAGLVSPESQLLVGNYITNLLDGMYSTIKFGMGNCYRGFMKANWGAACPRSEGIIAQDAVAELTYSPSPDATVDEVLDELSLVLTSSRLSGTNRAIIKDAFKNVYASNRDKGIRIAQQLIASTPEFHSTSISRKTGDKKQILGYTTNPSAPYKAVVYYMMTGGVDSFNMLVPRKNCKEGKDMFSEYTKARGSVALEADELLDIDATGSDQICNTFGINKKLPLLHDLYNNKDALWVTNAGVLSKPLTKHDNWAKDSNVRLFAHNHMQLENHKVNPGDRINAGSGVGGRLLDILRRKGFHTSGNTIDSGSSMVKGTSFDNNPVWNVQLKDPEVIDKYSTVGSGMLGLVKSLNGIGTGDDSLFSETWSSKSSQALFEYEQGLEFAELMKLPEYSMRHYRETESNANNRFRATAQYMKMRSVRKVNRDVFFVRHDGFDSHSEKKGEVNNNFWKVNLALEVFVDELKTQGIWNNTVIIMASDFGRSISENSNGGTDHAWGGNYFMLGGSVNGGKIVGQYPEHLTKESSQWISRGRMIPTTPLESIWHGVSNWMGVTGNDSLGFILPNMDNHRRCDMFTDSDLFLDGIVPSYDCEMMDSDRDGVLDSIDLCPNTPQDLINLVDESGCVPTPSPTVFKPTLKPTKEPTTPPTNATPTLSPTTEPPTSAPVGLLQQIPDSDGYEMVYELSPIPEKPDFSSSVGYTQSNTDQPPFSRVAYLMELDDGGDFGHQWVWVSMDAFTDDTLKIGVPCLGCAHGIIQETVNNVNVVSSMSNLEGSSLEGNIEFWPYNYYKDNSHGIPHASDDTYDSGDRPKTGGSYGSMQVHVDNPSDGNAPRNTVFAFNKFNSGNEGCLGIGTNTANGEHPDWTGSNNAGKYSVRKLHVYVKKEVFEPTQNPVKKPTSSPTTTLPTSSPTGNPTNSPISLPPTKSPTISTNLPTSNPVLSGQSTPVNTVLGDGTTGTFFEAENTGTPLQAYDGNTSRQRFSKITGNGAPGFVAIPSHPLSIVEGIRIYSGNCCKAMDPASYKIEGRHSGGTWTLIHEGLIVVGRKRNSSDSVIKSSYESPDTNKRVREVKFANSIAYSEYRVTFPTNKGDNGYVQIGEVELPGILI